MANEPFEIQHRDYPANSSVITVFKCTTDAGKPTEGFVAGDEARCDDTGADYVATSSTAWREKSKALFSQTAEGGVGDGVGEGTLFSTGSGSKNIPANYFSGGRILRINAGGRLDMIVEESITLRLRLKKGSTLLADTGVLSFTAAGNSYWDMAAVIMGNSVTSVFTHALFRLSLNGGLYAPLACPMKIAGGSGTTISASAEDMAFTADLTATTVATFGCRVLTMESFGAV